MTKLNASVIDCCMVVPGSSPTTLIASAATGADTAILNSVSLMRMGPAAFEDAKLLAKARESGLARARSAAPATWLAIIACAAAQDHLRGNVLGLVASSTSATESTAFLFERAGIEVGWKLADPFWLPNSIPSCMATSVFSALKLEGAAVGFPGGVHGFFGALNHALILLVTGAVQRAIVVIAEHSGAFFEELGHRSVVTHSPPTGAIAVVLEPCRQTRRECVVEIEIAPPNRFETEHTKAQLGPSSQLTYLDAFEGDIPASEIFRHRAGFGSAARNETNFAIRETGERFRLGCHWAE